MSIKILLADKSITIQKVVEILFSGRDYEVICVSDGETALSEAARVSPDVVLVDVGLPRVDGYSMADRLGKIPALASTPVILMMSRDDVYDSVRGKQSGIIDTIAKPFESQELIGKVKKAIAAAPAGQAEPAVPKPTAEPRPAAPLPQSSAAWTAAKPKSSAPTDIFSIIDEAPSLDELQHATVPGEEASVYEVEPEVEIVEEPIARDMSSALPMGNKALEEMRTGMGLSGKQQEGQPEVVTFESFDLAMDAAARETPRASKPETSAAPRTEMPPPMLSPSEVRSMAEETINRMARDVFKDMKPPIPKISEETVRRGIEEAVKKIAREVAQEVIEKVAWEVIPALAEHLIRAEIERLKAEP